MTCPLHSIRIHALLFCKKWVIIHVYIEMEFRVEVFPDEFLVAFDDKTTAVFPKQPVFSEAIEPTDV